MIWFLFGLMLLGAALAVTWPLYRRQKRLTPALAAAVVTVLGVSAVLYTNVGTPVPPAPAASVDEMVAALDRRLQETPEDLDGWKMLGRSYMQLQDYAKAIEAFERAVALENPADGQTLASLGEALLIGQGSAAADRTRELFESALAVEPNNPKALFYGGMLAINRGDRDLAADRWEALLALSPPPEIEQILRQRIAEWRGAGVPATQEGTTSPDRVVSINVSLGKDAAAAVTPDDTVFVIARDPEQPSPPIAAARRKVSELPAQVSLTDADAMLPGRLLSAFDRLEIVARVSGSGEPLAQPGDWYGDSLVQDAGSAPVDIVIEKRLP